MSDDTKYYGANDDVAAIEQKLKNLQTHYEARLDGQYARTADVEADREKLRVGIGKLVSRIKAADKILKDVANPLRVGDLSSTAEAHLAFYGPIEKFLADEGFFDPAEKSLNLGPSEWQ